MTKSPGLTSSETSGRNFFLESIGKTRIARVDPCAASVHTKNARADLNLPNPLSDARLDRSNVDRTT